MADLASFRLPDDEVIDWFRVSLQSAFTDISDLQRGQRSAQTKRRAELITMNDRLLNAFLAGSIDEATFNAKLFDLRYSSVAAFCDDAGIHKLHCQILLLL